MSEASREGGGGDARPSLSVGGKIIPAVGDKVPVAAGRKNCPKKQENRPEKEENWDFSDPASVLSPRAGAGAGTKRVQWGRRVRGEQGRRRTFASR